MRILLWPRYDGIHPTCALVLGECQKRLYRVTTMRWWLTPFGIYPAWTQGKIQFRRETHRSVRTLLLVTIS